MSLKIATYSYLNIRVAARDKWNSNRRKCDAKVDEEWVL